MAQRQTFSQDQLSRHIAQPPKFFGYTAMDWFKFYGLIGGLTFVLVLSWTRYFELFEDFDDRRTRPAQDVLNEIVEGFGVYAMPGQSWGEFVGWFSGLGLAFALVAIIGFFWWAAGALVRYSKWQVQQAPLWRMFWMVILLFYFIVLWDPVDRIHPALSLNGLFPAPNLVTLVAGDWPPLSQLASKPDVVLFQFQWGYFLLALLFWFLVFALHAQYLADGMRELWFYTSRFHRYGASVLTGFRDSAEVLAREPATRAYPRLRPKLPPAYRGVPRLAVESLNEATAQRIMAADGSGAIVSAPGQSSVLFVDLGRFDFSAELAALVDEEGQPLLEFTDYWALPVRSREELVIPLARPRDAGQPQSIAPATDAAEAADIAAAEEVDGAEEVSE